MKALIFDAKNQEWETSQGFEKVDVPRPSLDEKHSPVDGNSVIIQVHYAGVCGTDRGIWYRQAFKDQILRSIRAQDPGHQDYRIIGHEFLGRVVEKGSHVKDIEMGDWVTCESHVVCNTCYQCVRGEKHVCTNEKILGISVDGGFAEFIKVPCSIIWKTDTSRIRPEVAALQEPFGNAVHAASKTDLGNKTVLISGLGPIGLFLTLIAKATGAKKVIGIDPNPRAREIAKTLGIDEVIALESAASVTDASAQRFIHDEKVVDEVLKLTDGVGVDASFEMAGFNESVNNCLQATRRGGDVILFGIKNGNLTMEDHNRIIVQGYTIHCVIGRRLWHTWETAQQLLEDVGNGIQQKIFDIILEKGIDTIMPIDEYTKEAFERIMQLHPKVLLKF